MVVDERGWNRETLLEINKKAECVTAWLSSAWTKNASFIKQNQISQKHSSADMNKTKQPGMVTVCIGLICAQRGCEYNVVGNGDDVKEGG